MPCRYDPTPGEIAYSENKRREDLDRLTRENDELREIVIRLVADRDFTPPKRFLTQVTKSQISHRKQDLKRLEQTFLKSKDAEKLSKVWSADPSKPLKEQLGFDPDEF